MTGRILTVSTLVALAQAKAIISNHCPHPVYVWSVPTVGSAHTTNLSVPSGSRYEEPWRYGSPQNPGIALKVSTQPNGIYTGMDEINFAYSVDHSDKSKVWVDLSHIRGKAFENNLAFFTCHAEHKSTYVRTSRCEATDEIELVLCGTARSSPAKDSTSPKMISECYNDQEDSTSGPDDDHPKPATTSQSPSSAACTKCSQPESSTYVPVHESSQHTSSISYHKSQSVGYASFTAPGSWSYSPHLTPIGTVTSTSTTKVTKTKTITSQPPYHSEHKTESYGTSSKHTSEEQYQPPKSSSAQLYPAPPNSASDKTYAPPTQQTSGNPYAPPPKYTSVSQYGPPKHNTEQPYPAPPTSPSGKSYPAPPESAPEYSAPPKQTTEHPYAPPPKHTSEEVYPPPLTTRPYAPPQRTSESFHSYSVPQRPSYHSHGDRPVPTKPAGDEYDIPRPTPSGGDRWVRSALVCNNGKADCPKPARKSRHEHCRAKVTSLGAPSQPRILNSTFVEPRTLTTIPLKTIMRSEAAKHQTSAAPTAQSSRTFPATSRGDLEYLNPQCIRPYCDPVVSGLNCTKMALRFQALFVTYSYLAEWNSDAGCSFLDGLDDRRRFQDRQQTVCMKPICNLLKVGEADCEQIRSQMENWAEIDLVLVNWSKDTYCPKDAIVTTTSTFTSTMTSTSTSTPVTEPSARPHKQSLSARRVQSKKLATKVCITPFCKGLSDADCKKKEAELAQNAQDNGGDINYTIEPAVCNTTHALIDPKFQGVVDAILSGPFTTTITTSGLEIGVCSERFCDLVGASLGSEECELVQDYVKDNVIGNLDFNINITSRDEEGGPEDLMDDSKAQHTVAALASRSQGKASNTPRASVDPRVQRAVEAIVLGDKRGDAIICKTKFCEDYGIPDHCDGYVSSVKVWAEEESGWDIDFTDDDIVCGSDNPVDDPETQHNATALVSRPQVNADKRDVRVCGEKFCKERGLSKKMCEDFLKQLKLILEDKYDTDVEYTTDDDLCGPEDFVELGIQYVAHTPVSKTQVKLGERADISICVRSECAAENYTDEECQELCETAEELVKAVYSVDIDYSTSDAVCGPK